MALVAYLPALKAGYLWDDDTHLTRNPCIVGPKGLLDIWTSTEAQICPLVFTTFWFLKSFFGLNPLPYHLANILFHGASAMVLWRVLQRLKIPGAWFGAALWVLHPLQVESVAWVSEMKNTQSGCFFLLSILAFLRCLGPAESSSTSHSGKSWQVVLYAALAMASKSSTVILPLVLALCAWWMDGRWLWKRARLLAPVLLLSIIASLVTLWIHSGDLSHADLVDSRGLPLRIAIAGKAVWFYLGKIFWPLPLLPVYPGWEPESQTLLISWQLYLPAAGAVALLLVLWWNRRGAWRGAFFAYACFLAALLPVLGLISQSFIARYSAVADRYEYLASMSVLALIAALLVSVKNEMTAFQMTSRFAAAGVLVLLGLLSWRQSRNYRDPERFWSAALAAHPGCWVAYNSLGTSKLQRGDLEGAITDWTRAIEIRPHNAEAHANLGAALRRLGRLDEAIAHCQIAIEISPRDAASHNGLANALRDRGRIAEAVTQYETSLQCDPGAAPAANNLAWVLATCPDSKIRNPARAVEMAERAVQLTGGADPLTLRTLAAAYASAHRFADAGKTAELALSRTNSLANPTLAEALRAQQSRYRHSIPDDDYSLNPRP